MAKRALCRDCGARDRAANGRCTACGGPRVVCHDELFDLAIAHIDCDAFYAAVEKRDRPELRDQPLIIGGGRRGVVATACYIARLYGVRSAMPMFQALKACPDAQVLPPDMAKYSAVGKLVRERMYALTPLVQPVSIDEAYLDLSEIEAASPAEALNALAAGVEQELGITVSVGLAANKFLAKLASDLDKPRGFSVIGRGEARDVLAPLSVRRINGVGPALARRLTALGIERIGHIQARDPETLIARLGGTGQWLARMAAGEDDRKVEPRGGHKSISAETTLESDTGEAAALEAPLARLAERVAARLLRANLATQTVVLKLKSAEFRIRTRTATLPHPTQAAGVIHAHALALLHHELDGTKFRLIGVGASRLDEAAAADPPSLPI